MRLEDVTVQNVRVHGEGQGELLRLKPVVNQYMRKKVPGFIRNVRFENVAVTGRPGRYRVQLSGADAEHDVRGVTFQGLSILGSVLTRSSPQVTIGEHVEGVQFTLATPAVATGPNAQQATAVAEIRKLGGKVTFDAKSPDTSVIGVDLSGTRVTDDTLKPIGELTTLQSLYLQETGITGAGLRYLKGMKGLTTLNIGWNRRIGTGLENLEGLTQLQNLEMYSTGVTDEGLGHLVGLTGLQTLNLASTKVTDTGLTHLLGMKDLRTLNLRYTQVSDTGLEQLRSLRNLRSLALNGTRTTNEGIDRFRKELPNCSIWPW
jgi:hypothetical protein